MRYSQILHYYDTPAQFEGRIITAVYSEYTRAALRLDGNEVIAFTVEEKSVGKWFEVFPLRQCQLPSDDSIKWEELLHPMTIVSSARLWREEWLEPSLDPSSHLGSGPHSTQFAAVLGAAPESIENVVKVMAGFQLRAQDGSSLLVCSSDNAPFKLDLTRNADDIAGILRFHSCECRGGAFPDRAAGVYLAKD